MEIKEHVKDNTESGNPGFEPKSFFSLNSYSVHYTNTLVAKRASLLGDPLLSPFFCPTSR